MAFENALLPLVIYRIPLIYFNYNLFPVSFKNNFKIYSCLISEKKIFVMNALLYLYYNALSVH